jgi:hypothetical protein
VEDPVNAPHVVAIKYNNTLTPDPNRIRAFALNISLDNNGTIVSPGNFNADYDVYIGSMTFHVNSVTGETEVNTVGSPIADAAQYPDTNTLDGVHGITVEMASLYYGEANAPAASGTLLTFKVNNDCNTATNVTIEENAARGGVSIGDSNGAAVLEEPSVASNPTLVGCRVITPDFPPANNEAAYAMWVKAGQPAAWCPSACGGSDYQCKGDASLSFEGKDVYGGRTYVGLPDLGILVACWQKKDNDPCYPMCYTSEFDRGFEGKDVYGGRTWVGLPDLGILVAHWQKLDNDPCMTTYPCFP